MRTEKLEIVRYSAQRKVLKRVVCLAGFISVFRSRAAQELKFYVDALAFTGVGDLSEVLIDKRKATIEDFAWLSSTTTLQASDTPFLIDDISSSANGEGSIIFNDLREESKLQFSNDPEKISHNELFILKVLSLLSQGRKIVVLDDPLAELPEEIIEPVAKAMALLVEKNRALAIVTKLFVRPECWIENEHVARVQIEAPRQRTIGFASSQYAPTGQFKAEDLEEVRRLGRSSATFGVVNPSDLPPETNHVNFRHLSKVAVFAGASTALVAVLLFTSAKPLAKRDSGSSTTGGYSSNDETNSARGSSTGQSGNFSTSTDKSSPVKLALAEYPQDIQVAVNRAFSAPEEEIKQLPAFSPTPPREVPVLARNQAAPSQTPEVTDSSPASGESSESESDITERRAKLRQSFLEALARARERLAAERGE